MKEKVIQFGEGGFLRGFADWMIQKLNEQTDFSGSVAVVQPIPQGLCAQLSAQNCIYTHVCRGIEGVETKRIESISRCLNPYEDFESYIALAENPDFRFIISNTTEAGIAFSPKDKLTDRPANSFPAKLTQLLYHRFSLSLRGFVFLPCELIDKNGEKLRECILQYAELWNLGPDFEKFVLEDNIFCNTLVDRINTGYPKDEVIDVGFDDKMLNTSEFFHLWVIEGYADLFDEMPLDKCGLNVILTDKLEDYRTRKVRILNGAHTSIVAHALLSGLDTVKSCMDNDEMYAFLKKCVYDEIIPTLDLPKKELTEYADGVMKRFANPFIKHYLASISLNSISKFKVRVIPSLKEYIARFGSYPEGLTFSLYRLIEFYKKGNPNDDKEIIDFIKKASIKEILSNTDFWGEDISFLCKEIEKYDNKQIG